MRGRRREFVSSDLLGAPAWDIMLALFVAAIEQHRTTVSEIVLASGAPSTTALRWIEVLRQRGIIGRVPSAHDARVTYVFMEPEGIGQMAAFLEDAAQSLACVSNGCVGK